MRKYTPKRNSLRSKILMHFAANPDSLLTRCEIAERFGVSSKTVETAISLLKRDGAIKVLFGPGRTAYYARADGSTPKLPKPPRQPKLIRDWPSTSSYVPPRPIANSVWALGELQREAV